MKGKLNMSAQLLAWVGEHLPAEAAFSRPPGLDAITGDAGFRQYFRVNSEPSLIAVYAPPDREDIPAFVAKDLAMAAAGVRVPVIHAVDFRRGFLLQEDLGDQLLLPLLNSASMAGLYRAGEAMLATIQAVSPDPLVFPPYDRKLLIREMSLFPQWFVEGLLEQKLHAGDRQVLDDTFELLVQSALEQPAVVVHRDYHSRNLLLQASGEVGVVDFQDAVIGPVTYDLVSLLKDCYIRWPARVVRERALNYLRDHMRDPVDGAVDEGRLIKWFDLIGLQRHIKVLGIFSRLWLRDGKSRYLDDLPLVLRYTLEVVREYPELEPFNHWFSQRLIPLLPGQSWYREWSTAGE